MALLSTKTSIHYGSARATPINVKTNSNIRSKLYKLGKKVPLSNWNGTITATGPMSKTPQRDASKEGTKRLVPPLPITKKRGRTLLCESTTSTYVSLLPCEAKEKKCPDRSLSKGARRKPNPLNVSLSRRRGLLLLSRN